MSRRYTRCKRIVFASGAMLLSLVVISSTTMLPTTTPSYEAVIIIPIASIIIATSINVVLLHVPKWSIMRPATRSTIGRERRTEGLMSGNS